ncbi:hydrolase [Pedomonas mirosovicensis]|uniref:hydrolase n=1 Tax=Pedomonas mirosovicensis TaxID=2908641 RepID=UPI00216984FB|nr:hydrolase [Pedomonas mirosovicensis]MCH8684264.1 hydrolase [Pedomonas mirosovicensis]
MLGSMTRIDTREQAALDWIDGQSNAMIDTVRRWSAINSGSRNLAGLARMADVLREAFAPLGGDLRLVDPAPAHAVTADGRLAPLEHGRILRLSKRPEAPIRVLLAGHMDTVFAPDHPFQTPQDLRPGVINGPGVADMKGGLLVMLHALQALERSPWADRLGYEIVINADEEVSSLGSAPVLAEAARSAHLGLVYEPAMEDGRLAGARKGIGSFSIVAEGRSAHAGRNPQEGRNAVLAVADAFVRLAALTGAKEGLTVNVARMEGGAPTNVVPASAVGRFEIRVKTHADMHWAQTQAERIIAEVSAARDVALTLHGRFNRPPKPMDERQAALFAAVKLCGEDLGLPIHWAATGGCCDGNNLAAEGLAVVDTLGVRGGAIHSSDEFLVTESLAERARLSALLLMRLASGTLPVPPRGDRP